MSFDDIIEIALRAVEKHIPDHVEIPYHPHRRALYSEAWRYWWSSDRRAQLETCAIIATEPNELLAEKTGHDRMPVIIKPADYQRWLQPGPVEYPPPINPYTCGSVVPASYCELVEAASTRSCEIGN